VRTIEAPVGKFVSDTARKVGALYRAVTTSKTGPAKAIEYAAVAAIVIGVAAFTTARVRRHRKLTSSPVEARR
jgi:hypothetical protein